MCSWSGYPNRRLSWFLNTQGTPTANTGPTSDHTGSGGYYIYLESSRGVQGDDAILVSPVLPPTIGAACFSFWYHMYGIDIGQLQLLTSIGGVTAVQWQRQGNQANKWLQASITIQSNTNYQIFLKAIRSNGSLGDIAVDDLLLVHNACPHKAMCDFEQDMCGYTQESNDNFDWTRIQTATTTSGTGPTTDHTMSSTRGYYVYIESSSPRKPGDKARIDSPVYPGGGAQCLQFYYHMYGAGMGTLFVYVRNVGSVDPGSIIWSMNSNRGDAWLKGQANINTPNAFQIVFEGIVGANYTSDIALDDIQLLPTPCPSPVSCDFESGFCTFTNRKSDDYDWVLVTPQSTSFKSQVPSADHTTGSARGIIEKSSS
ncbi:hypothetical protein Btru_018317 [Bulinus truncatus]|nr:hypothetical protein Btru_018317 [Bulinus truncatus]